MKKTKTIEYAICDFHLADDGSEVEAMGIVQPTGEDVCKQHFDAFTEEIRLPDELGGDMSGHRIQVSPTYDAKMIIEYNKEK